MNASTTWFQHSEQARLAVGLVGVALAGRVVQAKVRDGANNEMIYAKTPEKIEKDRVCLGELMWPRSGKGRWHPHGNNSSHIRRSCTTGRCFIRRA